VITTGESDSGSSSWQFFIYDNPLNPRAGSGISPSANIPNKFRDPTAQGNQPQKHPVIPSTGIIF